MADVLSPEPCPGCGGSLYRLDMPTVGTAATIDATNADPGRGKVTRCSGRCELVDGVAGVIAAPRR